MLFFNYINVNKYYRIKLILQTQQINAQITHGNKYLGPIDCVRRVIKEQGFWSLWRGNVASVMRYFPSQAMNFAFKDKYKLLFSYKNGKIMKDWEILISNLLSGGAAGASSLTVTYPLDMARTRYFSVSYIILYALYNKL